MLLVRRGYRSRDDATRGAINSGLYSVLQAVEAVALATIVLRLITCEGGYGRVREERGVRGVDLCPTCGGRLLERPGRDTREGPDYKWRCTGSCGQWWTDGLRLSRPPARP